MRDTTDIIAELTLLEKAALLSGANTWQTRAIERVDLPAIWMSDGPHGVRKQVGSADHLGINGSEPATCFPTAATVANSWDEELAGEIGAALGRESRAQGVHALMGPGLNIKRSPLGGRDFEYFSEDPELAGRLAAAYVAGLQSEGVAATPKHFAVNSQELRRMVSDSVIDERTLREIYLTAFEIVVRQSHPWALMSAYNRINGVYAHENRHLLQEILRDEWGFDGAVISDWGGGNDVVASIRAGGTIEMPSPGFDSARVIVAAVESGELDENDLDRRVAEVIELVRRVRTDERPDIDVAAHHALARRAAAESAVLLKNEGDVLPLESGTRVALIGDFAETPRYQGSGSSAVNPFRVSTLRDALADSPLALASYTRGYRRDGVQEPALIAEAVAAARRADVAVLALGIPEIAESEGLDRADLVLPPVQAQLLREVRQANPRTVVVLSAGGVLETPWADDAAALLHTYLSGQAGAEGIVDVLTGAVNPGGRLAETSPCRLSDTPTASRFPSRARTAEYREGIFVGYRYYATAGVDVAYPFGFGLSYTRFAYSDLVVSETEASFTVTNTGARAGADVAQVYVSRTDPSAVVRPAIELVDFRKVRLQPGESTRVTIPFTERAFRFYDVRSGSWQVEAGTYEVHVGASSVDLPLHASIELAGTVAAGELTAEASIAAAQSAPLLGDDAFAALLGHPVPDAAWHTGPLGLNDSMDRLGEARSPLARLAFRILDSRRRTAEASGHPDLNILFLFNGPFRVISKMSGGLATEELARGVLTLVNGRTFRGLGQVIAAFFRGRRRERRSRDAFRSAASGAVTNRTR